MKLILVIVLSLGFYTQRCHGQDMCAYRQEAFNSDTCCWRLSAKSDSFNNAANLIVAYLQCKTDVNRHSLNWHAGQMFAGAGRYPEAKKYFHKTFNVFYKWFGGADGKAWFFYAKGTIAFLDNNRHKLHRIIKHWDKKLPKDINFRALQQLEANMGRSYVDATR